MKRRILTILLWVCLTACLLPGLTRDAQAAKVEVGTRLASSVTGKGTVIYEVIAMPTSSANGRVKAVECVDANTVVTLEIPGVISNGEGENALQFYVVEIEEYAFYELPKLETVSLPNYLERIGDCAFARCPNLAQVNLGDGVTFIGDNAFSNNEKLTTVTGGKEVKELGIRAFAYCPKLAAVPSFSKVTKMGVNVFCDCASLTSFTMPSALTAVPNGTFSGCTNLAEIDLANVTEIGNFAFKETAFTSVEIPEKITAIGEWAYYGCGLLTSVTIPASVTTISEEAFYNCSQLTTATLIYDAPKTLGEDVFPGATTVTHKLATPGATWIPWMESCYWKPIGVASSYTVKFYNESGTMVKEVTTTESNLDPATQSLPSGTYTFTVTAHADGYVSSDESAHASIGTVEGSGVVPVLSDAAATYADAATVQVTFTSDAAGWVHYEAASEPQGDYPDTTQGGCLIEQGENTITLTGIADDLRYLFLRPKAGNGQLGEVTMLELPVKAGAYLWRELEDGTVEITKYLGTDAVVTIPDAIDGKTVTSLGSKAFANLDFLTSVTLPSGLVTVGNHAFQDCDNLTTINLNSGLTHIGEGAFEHLDALETITFPDSLTVIGPWAFANCRKLTNLQFPENLEIIYYCAFIYCYGLTEVTIPDSVTSLGRDSFRHCTGLKTATLGAKVSSLGHRVFDDCPALETVTLGTSVKTIPVEMFRDCPALKTVNYAGTMADWQQISINNTDNDALYAADFYFEGGAVKGGYWGQLLYGYAADDGTITVLPPKGENLPQTISAGAYNAQGRLLRFLPAAGGSVPVTTGTATVRLFLLDGDLVPIQAEKVIEIG